VTAAAVNAPLKLLMTADAVGGVWTYAIDLARGLAPLGVRTTLAVVGPSPHLSQASEARAVSGLELIDTGLPLDWTADDPRVVRSAGAALTAIAASAGADVVQVNSAALAAGADFGVPLLIAAHSCVATWWAAVRGEEPLPEDFRWRTALAGEAYLKADAVCAPTAAFARATAEAYGFTGAPAIVRNGRRQPMRMRGPTGDAFVFTAGRLWDEGKNLKALDMAAARLSVEVVAAGPLSGPGGAAVSLPNLRTLGSLSTMEVSHWLSGRPIFASPSLYEPFGLSVLEAAQAGCPLVLADIPTFRELWGGAAVFVDPRDPGAWAEALSVLVEDEAERARYGAAAAVRARRYSLEQMVEGMFGLYRRLVPDTAAAAPLLRREAVA
jgi:glycosyltransferase involved in cell wall biosynthesis